MFAGLETTFLYNRDRTLACQRRRCRVDVVRYHAANPEYIDVGVLTTEYIIR